MGTPTIRLRSLDLKAFRSFVDKQHLDLPERGLHLLDAPSGHGKSSMAEALAVAFDYSQFPATEHQSWPWLTDETMEVDLGFYLGGQDAQVRRGKKPLLRIGEQTLTSASTIAKVFPEKLGIKPEMLKALTYRPQRQRGLFLSFTDAEKKSFLTELLHLGAAETEAERTQKAITKLDNEAAVLQAVATQALASLPQEPQPPAALEDTYPLRTALEQATSAATEAGKKLDESVARQAAMKRDQEQRVAQVRSGYVESLNAAKLALDGARREMFAADPEAGAKLKKLEVRLKFIQDGIAKFRREHRDALSELSRKHLAAKEKVWGAKQAVEDLARATERGRVLAAEIEAIQRQQCPTCEQRWARAATKLEAKQREVDEAVRLLSVLAKYAEALPEAEAEEKKLAAEMVEHNKKDPVPEKFQDGEREQQAAIGALQEQQRTARAQFDQEKASRVSQLQADLRALEAEQARAAAEAENDEAYRQQNEETSRLFHESHRAERAVLDVETKLKMVELRNKNVIEQFEREYERWLKLRKGADDEQQRAVDAEKRLRQEEDFLALVKSFLSLVFDETLQSVAGKANEFLVGIPNVAGFTLDFVSERETKSGTVRQEIKPVVRKDGHDISLRGCSGGQQAAIELAVDLALAEVIAERTGCYPGWLVLDEPFDGLGAADKEAAMAVLARVAEDRAIFVIDHAVEVKESFDSVISVRYQDGRSTFA